MSLGGPQSGGPKIHRFCTDPCDNGGAMPARIGPGIYETTLGSAARVRLLREAAADADLIEVHVPLVTGAHLGRLLRDVPRRALASLRLPSREPGVRNGRQVFFDDETLANEAACAGLHLVARRGSWVVFGRGVRSDERPDPFAFELARAARVMPSAEAQRRVPPITAIRTMRARGRFAPKRGLIGRARLRRAIGWLDAATTRPNCYRRTLAEIALDAGAAEETLVFGLDVGRTGHVAFAGAEEVTFDVAFEVPPE
jgi:hypothetical protein